MHQIFFLSRIYPYWAIPLAVCVWQLAIHFHRRGNKAQYPFWILMGILLVSSVAWIGFRGDKHADTWVRWVES